MRKQFVPLEYAETEPEVIDLCPWASVIEMVEGGWIAYECLTEYETATKQV
jgi:hypothetical protein